MYNKPLTRGHPLYNGPFLLVPMVSALEGLHCSSFLFFYDSYSAFFSITLISSRSLILMALFSLQATSQYTVNIVAEDNGNPRLSNTSIITVSLTDLNEFSPKFIASLEIYQTDFDSTSTPPVYEASAVYTVDIGKILHIHSSLV